MSGTTIASVRITEFSFEIPGSGGRTSTKFGVRITADDGTEGGYVALWSAPPLAVPQVHAAAQLLVGQDYRRREHLWDQVNRTLAKNDRIGYGALDIALWDLAGKGVGQPIWALLGGFRDRLPAYVSTIGGVKGEGTLGSGEAYADFAQHCVEYGARAYKFHGYRNADLAGEIEVLRAVADRIGGRAAFMTDPGKGLPTLADALQLGWACDETGAYWWEDPVRGDSAHAHRILRDKVRTPLLITEFVRGLDQRIDLAIAGATDFLRGDPELDMGITGVMKTARAAEALGMDLEVHAAGPAQRHCMAAIRNTNYYELGLLDPELGNPLMPPVYTGDYVEDLTAIDPADGCVAVPDGPGLGVSYDWAWIEAHAVSDRVIGR
ncbi:enolase C-terminal domain-like protein [Leifsonia sp. NPDC058230]|uniref:enolase C-terminal domain-like protein n=1 Tax=Leifsonia sp. NPDC058230 TaxID=3346391 RepID=UPI0036D90B4F